MQRKFVTNLAFLLFLNLLVKPIWLFVFDAKIQGETGDDYGLYFGVLSFSFLFNILPDLGITQFNTRNIAMHTHLLKKHVPALLGTKLVLGLVYFGFVAVLGLAIGYRGLLLELLFWLGINQFLISLINYFRSNLAGLHLFKQDSMISVLDRSIMMIICSVLLWGGVTNGEFQIRWFVWLQTAAYGLTAVVAFILVLRKSGRLSIRFNWPFSLMIIRKSLPFAVLFVLMSFYSRTDSVMLERLLDNGAEETGIYAQSYRLLDAVNMFALLFASLLLPIFARQIKERLNVAPLVNLAYRLLFAISVTVAVSCFFYADDLMGAIYQDKTYLDTPAVFAILMFGFIAMSTTYVFGTLLTANGSLKALNLMAAITAVLNIGLNFVVIPRYGALGAAIASLVSQGLAAVIQLLLAQRFFKFTLKPVTVLAFLLFAAGIVALAWGSTHLHSDWRINFAALVATSIAWVFVARMINLKQLWVTIKESRSSE